MKVNSFDESEVPNEPPAEAPRSTPNLVESCSPKCLRDVLTDRGLELMASDGDFAMNCYECRECNSWCLRHEVEP